MTVMTRKQMKAVTKAQAAAKNKVGRRKMTVRRAIEDMELKRAMKKEEAWV